MLSKKQEESGLKGEAEEERLEVNDSIFRDAVDQGIHGQSHLLEVLHPVIHELWPEKLA